MFVRIVAIVILVVCSNIYASDQTSLNEAAVLAMGKNYMDAQILWYDCHEQNYSSDLNSEFCNYWAPKLNLDIQKLPVPSTEEKIKIAACIVILKSIVPVHRLAHPKRSTYLYPHFVPSGMTR